MQHGERVLRTTFLSAALAAAAVAAGDQARLARPAVSPAAPSALVSDIQQQFDAMERSIEMAYARLVQDAKNQKQSLEDKIRSLESQIEKLKQNAKKIDLLAKKIEQLLPRIMAELGKDTAAARGRSLVGARNAEAAEKLATELAKAGVELSPDEIRAVTDAVRTGGEPAAQRHLNERLAGIDKAIEAARTEIKSARDQIAVLDREIAKLKTEREQMVAELRKQKAKLLEQAAKATDQATKAADPGAKAAIEAALRDILAALQAQIANRALPTRTPAANRR